MSDNAYVTIRSFFEPSQALFLRSVLEGHGIESFVVGEHTGGLTPLFSLFGGSIQGGIRLQVHADDLAAAQEILDTPGDALDEEEDEEDVEDEDGPPEA
jgi:hypothetical protein